MKPTSNPFLSGAIAVAMTLPALADTTITQGINNIDTTGNPDLGIITRNTGGVAWFNNTGTASATGSSNVDGILGSWAFTGTGTSTRYASINGSNNVIAFTSATAASAFGWTSSNNATFNYDVAAVQAALGVSRTANTARYTGAAGTQIWGNSGANVTITLNGLINAGSGTLTFAKGGTGTGTGLVIGASRDLVLNAASAAIAISAPIFNNAGGASALTITGPSGVTLSGANTYTGGTTIASGSLTLTGGNLGTGGIHVASGATLNINSTQTISQAVSGAGSISNNGGTGTISGDFSGFSGTFTHNSSTVSTAFNNVASTSKDAAYHIATPQGSLQGIILGVATGSNVYEMGALSGVTNSLLRNGLSVSGTNTIQVGNLDTNTNFAGTIGGGGGTMALTKVGTGALTLSGANTYTGDTVVSAGTLFVNGSLGNSAVSVEAAATIGGTGDLAGDLTMDATSFFEVVDISNPLSVAGTITFGSGFGIENITGVDWASLTKNTPHTLISTSQVFTSADIANFGLENAADLGGGLFAYFENGSLAVVVIPEPAVTLLGCFGILGLLRRRR
jgi:autotransporter-associated beta strand protein